MSELLRTVQFLSDNQQSERIQQLTDQVNQLITAHNGAMNTAATSSLLMGIVWTVLTVAAIWLCVDRIRLERRIKALETQKS